MSALGERWEAFLEVVFAKLSAISFYFMSLCAGQYINLICSIRELICIKLSLILVIVSLW